MEGGAAVITHVLIDKGDGHDRSVITQTGEPVLIPTPEWWKGSDMDKWAWRSTDMGNCYAEGEFDAFDERKVMFQGKVHTLASFLEEGKKYRHYIMHDDPEFNTWTYGVGVGTQKRLNQLVNNIINHRKKGDCIFLGASMKVYGREDIWAKFLIGVLVLEAIYYKGFKSKGFLQYRDLLQNNSIAHEIRDFTSHPRISQNFHYKAQYNDDNLFIITGERDKSALIKHPIRLTGWKTSDGSLIAPFKNWVGMKKFWMGSPGIYSQETVKNLLDLICDTKQPQKLTDHPDFKKGTYSLAL